MFQSPPTSYSSKNGCQVDPNKGADNLVLEKHLGSKFSVGRWENGPSYSSNTVIIADKGGFSMSTWIELEKTNVGFQQKRAGYLDAKTFTWGFHELRHPIAGWVRMQNPSKKRIITRVTLVLGNP